MVSCNCAQQALLLQRADPAPGAAVGLRLAQEGGVVGDAQPADRAQEVDRPDPPAQLLVRSLASAEVSLRSTQPGAMDSSCFPCLLKTWAAILVTAVWQTPSTSGTQNASGHGMRSLPACTPARRQDDQRLRWSVPMWSPPPESNRRPHPYHRCSGGSRRHALPHSPTRPSR
jgi:hypothetical protein